MGGCDWAMGRPDWAIGRIGEREDQMRRYGVRDEYT
jgi:hypothetical protein